MTPVGFEPTPFRNGALSHRLRPLGQSVLAMRPSPMLFRGRQSSQQAHGGLPHSMPLSLPLRLPFRLLLPCHAAEVQTAAAFPLSRKRRQICCRWSWRHWRCAKDVQRRKANRCGASQCEPRIAARESCVCSLCAKEACNV